MKVSRLKSKNATAKKATKKKKKLSKGEKNEQLKFFEKNYFDTVTKRSNGPQEICLLSEEHES